MGASTYGGKGFKGRAAVSGERPIGTASCRQQHTQASCQTPPSNPHPPFPKGQNVGGGVIVRTALTDPLCQNRSFQNCFLFLIL